MLDWLDQISGSHWYLLLIFAFAAVDAVFPVVPSEVALIIGGVAAGLGNQAIVAVVVLGAAGAITGDNIAYLIGRKSGSFIERRFLRGNKGQKRRERLDWADEQIDQQGVMLLVTARFVPGGRTATTIAWGLTGQRWARFALGVGIAGVIWATYSALLGFIGGRVFAERSTLAFLLAFGVALAINLALTLVRRLRKRNHDGDEDQPGSASAETTSWSDTASKDR